jgi:hypothetical protein
MGFFVSREHHSDVCAGYERVIVALRAQIAMLEKRLEQPIPVTVVLPKDFAVIAPAVVQNQRRKKKQQDADVLPAAPTYNLADLDENDNLTLTTVALAKYGRRHHNAYELSQWVRGIKTEILAAKAAKRRREQQEANEPAPKMEELQADSTVAPAHIVALVEEAERGDE